MKSKTLDKFYDVIVVQEDTELHNLTRVADEKGAVVLSLIELSYRGLTTLTETGAAIAVNTTSIKI